MYDLEKLEQQLANYVAQRITHQQIFHQLSGAISAIEEVIALVKKDVVIAQNPEDGQPME